MENRAKSRRQFIKTSAMGAIGAGLAGGRALAAAQAPANPPVPGETPRIREYRVLGRTGFKVSDISCGFIMDEGVIRAAYESGMNYFDTAEQYPGHHRALGRALQGMDRKKVFVATKLEVADDKSKEGFLKRARKALEELGLEYVDCLMMHCPEKAETLKTEGFHAAMAELKAEGRLRHVGVSQHGTFWFRDPEETMDKILLAAAEDGRFDVFLMAYNFLRRDNAEKVLEACREKKIGVALMKTAPIAIYQTLKERVERLEKEQKPVNPLYADGLARYKEKYEAAQAFIAKHDPRNPDDIRDAAIRFVLGHPDVHTVCYQTQTYDALNTIVRLSGTRLAAAGTASSRPSRRAAEGCIAAMPAASASRAARAASPSIPSSATSSISPAKGGRRRPWATTPPSRAHGPTPAGTAPLRAKRPAPMASRSRGCSSSPTTR